MTREIKTLTPEIWDIDKLIPYKNNSKIHKPEQVARLAESIKDQGLEQYPHVQPDGVIITGHGRTEALKLLGYTKVPVYVRHDLDELGWRKLRLASNKSSSVEYDVRLEKIEVNEMLNLLGESADLGQLALQTGFSERDFQIFTEDLGESAFDLDGIDLSEPTIGEELAKESDDGVVKGVPVAKLLGFKAFPTTDARLFKKFISGLREQAGESVEPCEALMVFVRKQMEV